jgi:hypothetical protein
LQKQIARTAGEGDVPLACRHITDENTPSYHMLACSQKDVTS